MKRIWLRYTGMDMDRYGYDSHPTYCLSLSLCRELEPMYKALHAYVRRNLRRVYGDEHISKTGTLAEIYFPLDFSV